MKLWQALISGLAGVAFLAVLHETARRVSPDASRMDLLGMQRIRIGKGIRQSNAAQ